MWKAVAGVSTAGGNLKHLLPPLQWYIKQWSFDCGYRYFSCEHRMHWYLFLKSLINPNYVTVTSILISWLFPNFQKLNITTFQPSDLWDCALIGLGIIAFLEPTGRSWKTQQLEVITYIKHIKNDGWTHSKRGSLYTTALFVWILWSYIEALLQNLSLTSHNRDIHQRQPCSFDVSAACFHFPHGFQSFPCWVSG